MGKPFIVYKALKYTLTQLMTRTYALKRTNHAVRVSKQQAITLTGHANGRERKRNGIKGIINNARLILYLTVTWLDTRNIATL